MTVIEDIGSRLGLGVENVKRRWSEEKGITDGDEAVIYGIDYMLAHRLIDAATSGATLDNDPIIGITVSHQWGAADAAELVVVLEPKGRHSREGIVNKLTKSHLPLNVLVISEEPHKLTKIGSNCLIIFEEPFDDLTPELIREKLIARYKAAFKKADELKSKYGITK